MLHVAATSPFGKKVEFETRVKMFSPDSKKVGVAKKLLKRNESCDS